AGHLRAGGEPQGRQGAGIDDPSGTPRTRRRSDRMKRREFITLIGGAAAAWPLAARAQQPVKPVRIGYLSATSPSDVYMEIFRQGMGDVGYLEGRDFVIEPRFAHRDYSRFPALVEEMLSAKVVLIVMGGPASTAAPFAAKSVPVVFGFSGDPVDAGIVSSFARPGGNATGISFLQLDLAPKRVDLLKEAVPAISKVAVLSNPDTMPVTHRNCGRLAMRLARAAWQSNTSRFGLMTASKLLSRRSRKAIATRCSRFPTH